MIHPVNFAIKLLNSLKVHLVFEKVKFWVLSVSNIKISLIQLVLQKRPSPNYNSDIPSLEHFCLVIILNLHWVKFVDVVPHLPRKEIFMTK